MEKLFSNVEIEINTNCNRKCSYCPNSLNVNMEKRSMRKEVFERILDELYQVSFAGRISYHFYNEPLLCENIEYFVERTKERLPKCKQVLYSNGDWLSKVLFQSLSSKGIDLFVITNHNELDNLELHTFYHVYEMLSEKEKKSVVYLTAKDLNLTNRGGALSCLDVLNDVNVPCYMMESLIVIDVDGNIICCFEDYYKKMIVGNIMKSKLLEIWNKKEYVSLRHNLIQGNRGVSEVCKNCNNYTMKDEALEYDYIL